MADARKSWHQQSKETERQFELFEFFLSLEPALRSYQNVSEKFSISREYVERIAKKFNWAERCRARNNYFAALADDVKATAVRDMAFDWMDWEMQNLDRVRGITESLLCRCEQMLDAPLTKQVEKAQPIIDPNTRSKLTDRQGNIIFQKITIIKPVRFSASDVPKYVEAAVILTKFLAQQNYVGVPLSSVLPTPNKPVETMSVEEREQYIQQLRKQQQIARGENIKEFDDNGEQ